MGRGNIVFLIQFFVWKRKHNLEFTYHWRSKPFVLWLLLTMECMANYNSPSVGDCCKLRQDMKGLWGMAVLVMGRGQIEQRRGQHTFIISIVSLVQRQSKDQGLRLRGCYPPTQRNETNESLYPWRWPGFSSLMLSRWSTFSIISFDIAAQSWYNPEGYLRSVNGSLAGQCYPKVKQLPKKVDLPLKLAFRCQCMIWSVQLGPDTSLPEGSIKNRKN